ncbi:MAG: hypothetical protein EHM42_11245, partial [Planctomycetaceae bacterium]
MKRTAVSSLLSALDLEQAQLFLAEHWSKACADPLGYTFWGVIWGCAFAATFLLIRMFFTGWGDRNVTEKTLGLSILMHAVIAMLSTTVMLATESRPPAETRTRIRRVVVEGDQSQTQAALGATGGKPRWDQSEQFASQVVDRLEQPSTADDSIPQRTQTALTPGVELPVQTPVTPAETPPANPQAVRVRERTPIPQQIDAAIDTEATAMRRQ